MSIEDEIRDRCGRGMLFPLLPLAPGATIRRALFLGEELYEALNSEEGDEEWEERIGHLLADLENFVTSRELSPKFIFLLYPARDCVWEIRSRRPSPSIRALGLFAAKDTLIVTNMALREWLGGWNSREWKQVKRKAQAVWRHLFSPYNPINETKASLLFSGATNDRFFKNMER